MTGHVGYVPVSCLAAVVKFQKSKMFKFHQFLDMYIQQIVSQIPVHFENLQEDLGHMWKSSVGAESSVNQ